MSVIKRVCGAIAQSPLYKKAQQLTAANKENYWLPLNKLQKAYLGSYMVLYDYSTGDFPPTFEDQAAAYQAEENFFFALSGVDPTEALDSDLRKPFWLGNERYIMYFMELCDALKQCGIKPPQTVLELGAGSGWISEFLALMKFRVIATTIGKSSVDQIRTRAKSLEIKGFENSLVGFQAPMESIDVVIQEKGEFPVDVVFVFEALHHAFDWEKTFSAVYNCLKPGGWFIICREPNLLHTFVSYRLAKLSNTHEIGMSRSKMQKVLNEVGFSKQKVLKNHLHFFVRPHWIAAQK